MAAPDLRTEEVVRTIQERDRAEAEVERLREGLAALADKHHRTIRGSKKHDPENQEWTDCSCLSCRKAQELLNPEAAS